MEELGADAIVVLLRDGSEVANWPLPGTDLAHLAVIDEVAHLALAAKRLGCAIRLRSASSALVDLLDLVGLAELIEPTARGV